MGCEIAGERRRVRDAREQHRDVGRADVGADRARGLGPRDESVDRGAQVVAQRLRGRGQLELVRHLLGERAVARLEVGERDEELSNAAAASTFSLAANACASNDSYIEVSTASTSACLVGKLRHTVPTPTPARRATSSTWPFRPDSREDLLGRRQHPLPVAAGHRPGGVARPGPEGGVQAESRFRL